MKTASLWLTLALASTLAAAAPAPVPAPEQLLPADTLALLTAPDCTKLEQAQRASPMGQLWHDPALAPFKDKLVAKFAKDLLEPAERALGIKFADYRDLARGQVTLALTQNGWTGQPDVLPGMLLLVDAREKSDQLKRNLADIRKKWTDANKKLKTERIRDVEFTTLLIDLQDLKPAVQALTAESKETPAASETAPTGTTLALSFAQVDSLLLAGTSAKDLEKVLVRLAGGTVPTLAEQPAFEANYRTALRDSLSYGWVHFSPVADVLKRVLAAEGAKASQANPMVPPLDKLAAATGLLGIRTLGFAAQSTPDGEAATLFLGVPESARTGLFKVLVHEAKDAGPPPFVPADAIQFVRFRLDGAKAWAGLEAMLNEIQPGIAGFVIGQMEAGLKEKDPNFDFRRNFIANLGDDFISYQKAPRGTSLADFNAPPSLFLLRSPAGDQVIGTVRQLLGSLPPGMTVGEFKEREFQGRKIYSVGLPAMPLPDGGQPVERSFHLTASGNYVALSGDASILEEFLRSGDAKPKPLAERSGLSAAAAKVGGFGTGLFGYQDDVESMRATLEMLRKNSDFIEQAFGMLPLPKRDDGQGFQLKDWADFSLLPAFDKIAKYFHLTVYAGAASAEALTLKFFTPTPPQMRR